MSSYTPMIQQYLEIKSQYPDAILFFRLGDFYEMFFEDAEKASKELEITLTARDGGNDKKVPMCGVPFHAATTYIAKLINKGYNVAICEQVEDPGAAKGIVKREVIRVITPGTVLEENMLDEKQNNFLIAVNKDDFGYGLAVADVSTGYFAVTELRGAKALNQLIDEISRLQPVECLIPDNLVKNMDLTTEILKQVKLSLHSYSSVHFSIKNATSTLLRHFATGSLEGFGCLEMSVGISCAGALMAFLAETQKNSLKHINKLIPYTTTSYMLLDPSTRRNLELTRTIRDSSRKGTLLWVLDYTQTAMGGRLLKTWLEQPLTDITAIETRLDTVEELVNNVFMRGDLQKLFTEVYDLERLAGRIAFGSANARDLIALKKSLQVLPKVKEILEKAYSPGLIQLYRQLDILEDVASLIESAIDDNPPITLRDGGIIKKGYNEEIDRLRKASRDGKTWIAELERREKERTGIKSLKVGYNKVFGYYIEVTRANLDAVPDDYIRKQTLANAERFITPDLKEYESLILGAEEKITQLEYELFQAVREKISNSTARIQQAAAIVAQLDVYTAFAEAAIRNNYTKPIINDDGIIKITDGRHPVVEKFMPEGSFVPNDTYLDCSGYRMDIITGPNMAGKSTYMRQVALIVLMAQIGSYVPASEARIGIVDRIFTRVGASDDLATGQSTFMVEMNEVANILNNATAKSLIILDEVGRGTSTFDGLSIAWAVAEYILDPEKIGAKTLFATHYHELTELADIYPGVQNHNIAVKEKGDDIIFLRKIIPGGADRSYGIQVARLAGLPGEVLGKAKEILRTLEVNEDAVKTKREVAAARKKCSDGNNVIQLRMFDEPAAGDAVAKEILSLDLLNLTPLEALNYLYKLQQKLRSLSGE